MILEVAEFKIEAEESSAFEQAMLEAVGIIASAAGYLGHTIQRCLETPGRFLLIVRWSSLEAHTQGFRNSNAFEEWKTKLGHFRNGARVEHFATVLEHQWDLSSKNLA